MKQNNLAKGVVSFECEKRRYSTACKAKANVFGNQVVGQLHEHTHGSDPTRSEVIRNVQEMKTRAEDTEDTLQQILTQSVSMISRDAAARLLLNKM